jgi:hypothetical protein
MKQQLATAALVSLIGAVSVSPALAQQDPGVRGGFLNTAGMLQYRGIPIPHPPVISPNPTTAPRSTPMSSPHSPRGSTGLDNWSRLVTTART